MKTVTIQSITFDFTVSDPAFGISTADQQHLTDLVTGTQFEVEAYDDDTADEFADRVSDTISDHTGWLVSDLKYTAG